MSPHRHKGPAGVVLSALLALGCGGAQTSPEAPIGITTTAPAPEPVELELRDVEERPFRLSATRGGPVLVFVFATWDGYSQASLTPLRQMSQRHPEVTVVGIAAQPDAAALADAWDHALDPPFEVYYDPTGAVELGTSTLGELEAVPTFVALDAAGVVRARHVGLARPSVLEELVSVAVEASGGSAGGEAP